MLSLAVFAILPPHSWIRESMSVAAKRVQRLQGAFLVEPDQARVPRNVGRDNGRQSSLLTFRHHNRLAGHRSEIMENLCHGTAERILGLYNF